MLKVELKGTLDEVIQQLICLKEQRIDAYTLYEGHALFSKYISYDYAYLTIHGITYREFLEETVTLACGLKTYGINENQMLLEMLPNFALVDKNPLVLARVRRFLRNLDSSTKNFQIHSR